MVTSCPKMVTAKSNSKDPIAPSPVASSVVPAKLNVLVIASSSCLNTSSIITGSPPVKLGKPNNSPMSNGNVLFNSDIVILFACNGNRGLPSLSCSRIMLADLISKVVPSSSSSSSPVDILEPKLSWSVISVSIDPISKGTSPIVTFMASNPDMKSSTS